MSSILSQNETDMYTKMIFGSEAIRMPFNFIRQDATEDRGLILGFEEGKRLAYGSIMTHQLWLAEIIIRPRVVIESEHLIGMGAAGIITGGGDVSEWIKHGNILYDESQ